MTDREELAQALLAAAWREGAKAMRVTCAEWHKKQAEHYRALADSAVEATDIFFDNRHARFHEGVLLHIAALPIPERKP